MKIDERLLIEDYETTDIDYLEKNCENAYDLFSAHKNNKQILDSCPTHLLEKTITTINSTYSAHEKFKLAEQFENGAGVSKSIPRAIEWYKFLAEGGYAPAQYRYSTLVDQDDQVSYYSKKKYMFEWMLKAAEQGICDAQFRIGYYYYNGISENKSYEKAFEWFDKATKNGHLGAYYYMGVMFHYGLSMPTSFEKSKECFEIVAKSGFAPAQYQLGLYYFEGKGVEQSYEKAFEWFMKASEHQNVLAYYKLGLCYFKGKGVEQSYEKAFEWFMKASEHNHASSMLMIAQMFEYGIGVEQSSDEAKKWYSDASNNYSIYAYYINDFLKDERQSLAKLERRYNKDVVLINEKDHKFKNLFLNNSYYNIDYKNDKNCNILIKMANKNDLRSQYILGCLCYDFYTFDESEKWMTLAAKQNDVRSQYVLGATYYYLHRFKDAFGWIKKAAEQNDFRSLCLIAWMLEKYNIQESASWYRKAIVVKFGKLNLCYIKDYKYELFSKTVFESFIESADDSEIDSIVKNIDSDVKAQYVTGLIYLHGTKNIKQSDSEAFTLIEKAANNGHRAAQFSIGVMYEYGIGVEKSKEFAHIWYLKAANLGDHDAMARIIFEDYRNSSKHKAINYHSDNNSNGSIREPAPCIIKTAKETIYKKGECEENWLRIIASKGNAKAQYKMGQLCLNDKDDVSYKKAAEWLLAASSQGEPHAKYLLAGLYYQGLGMEKSYKDAYELLQESSKKGVYTNSTFYFIGLMYEEGKGTEKSYENAIFEFKKILFPFNTENDGPLKAYVWRKHSQC